MNYLKCLSIVSVVLILGCGLGTLPPPEASNAEEQAYFMKVSQTPLTLTLPNSEADDAWGRAQSFIGKYSSMKLQVAMDYVLQTYNPTTANYGYYVTRTPMGDETEFDVRCLYEGFMGAQRQEINARVLAYYMQTGELNPKFVSQ